MIIRVGTVSNNADAEDPRRSPSTIIRIVILLVEYCSVSGPESAAVAHAAASSL